VVEDTACDGLKVNVAAPSNASYMSSAESCACQTSAEVALRPIDIAELRDPSGWRASRAPAPCSQTYIAVTKAISYECLMAAWEGGMVCERDPTPKGRMHAGMDE
jgi:hypothetical protein